MYCSGLWFKEGLSFFSRLTKTLSLDENKWTRTPTDYQRTILMIWLSSWQKALFWNSWNIKTNSAINKKVMSYKLIGLIFGGISVRDTQTYPIVRTYMISWCIAEGNLKVSRCWTLILMKHPLYLFPDMTNRKSLIDLTQSY